ncbi:MAG: bifunctional DNA-formamidopyrimidine glycosylase/DNA-(apurinic or apyrimidinic site) lyase [Lentisphaerae bacterium]|nr:bifunctional DNA-formamidopyrimidine glycosylase/DNA-(apurinic or apyrimidinic site) lyase [Lentisphaerota bacterium]
MPELPEVETVVRGLRAGGLCGARIVAVELRWPRTFGPDPVAVRRVLTGATILAVGRRGKYIVLDLDGGRRVLLHLRMTGKLRFAAGDEPRGPHDHVRLALDDGRLLVFNDTRKFGRFALGTPASDPLADLGPEPLGPAFKLPDFARELSRRGRAIKPLLLDQRLVAGLGNIYVDESLWQAGVHPGRPASSLTADEARALHGAIRQILARAVRDRGTTLGSGQSNFYSVAGRRGRHADRLNVFRRDGEPCPRCGTTLARLVVAQRGTHICPACQRLNHD